MFLLVYPRYVNKTIIKIRGDEYFAGDNGCIKATEI